MFAFHNSQILSTQVPPPSNLTITAYGVQSFQIAWTHPSGYDPGKFSPGKQSNSTLDEYRFWMGDSEAAFTILTSRSSLLPTSFTINSQAFDIQVGRSYFIRVSSRTCCSSLVSTFFSQACTGLTCQSSASFFSSDSNAYPLNGYAFASAISLGYPSAPSTFNISVVSDNSQLSYPSKGAVLFQWSLPADTGSANQVSMDILAYQVTRARNSTFVDGLTIFFGLPALSGGLYSAVDTGLIPGALYYYRINARNLACGMYARTLSTRNQSCVTVFTEQV